MNRGYAGAVWRNEIRRKHGSGNSFPPGFGVIHAVIMALTERIFTHRTTRVIGDIPDVRREETLIRFMHARGDVGPPEKRLHERRAVIGADFEFEKTFAGMQTDAMHALHAAHRIVITAPDGL